MSLLTRVGAGILVLVVVLLLIGQLLGQPILLGYVATGSMEPTMNTGDGFVAIPNVVTGEPSVGDIVVFEARELHGGGLTTHRIVDETDEGYITRGDNNPFTDQDGDEPPVTNDQIVAVAWQVGGSPVTIPYLGSVLMGVHDVGATAVGTVTDALGVPGDLDGDGMGAILVGFGVALLGFGFLFDRGGGVRSRTRVASRENVYAFWTVVGVVLLALVLFTTAAMVLPAGVTEYELISTQSPSDDPQVLPPGETGEVTHTVDNQGYLPIVAVHGATNPTVGVDPPDQVVGPRSSAETTVSLTAPAETGSYTRHVSEHRYVTVLPPSVLVALHTIHPLVAIAAVNGVVVGAAVATITLLFGWSDFRLRPGGNRSVAMRWKRKLLRWFE